jgi:hypothetical protein
MKNTSTRLLILLTALLLFSPTLEVNNINCADNCEVCNGPLAEECVVCHKWFIRANKTCEPNISTEGSLVSQNYQNMALYDIQPVTIANCLTVEKISNVNFCKECLPSFTLTAERKCVTSDAGAPAATGVIHCIEANGTECTACPADNGFFNMEQDYFDLYDTDVVDMLNLVTDNATFGGYNNDGPSRVCFPSSVIYDHENLIAPKFDTPSRELFINVQCEIPGSTTC